MNQRNVCKSVTECEISSFFNGLKWQLSVGFFKVWKCLKEFKYLNKKCEKYGQTFEVQRMCLVDKRC